MPQPTNHIVDPEPRINSTLGKLLRDFNFLDLNLGLCLSHLENPGAPEKSYDKLAKMTVHEKVQNFHRLVEQGTYIGSGKRRRFYDEWYETVDRCRLVRNFYVHGTWEYLPMRSSGPLHFCEPPWIDHPLRDQLEETMTLERFENLANEISDIFEGFMKIRQQNGI